MRYIEIILCINLAIHLIFVGIANYIMRQKKNNILIFLSCIMDAIYTWFYIYMPYELEPYKYLCIFVISITPFLRKGLSKALLLSLVYLMLNFTLGGSAEVLYAVLTNFLVVLCSILIIGAIFIVYAMYRKYHVVSSSFTYDVYIEDGSQSFYLNGFCDSGNFLTTDDNIPIVFLNHKIQIGRYKKSIEVQSVSVKKKISLYEVKEFKIKIKNKYVKRDVYLAYADISYMVMFGLNILGG